MFSRNTRQRSAIQETFRQNDRPLRPEEVLIHSQQTVEGIGITTVYRTIRTLVDEGWLVEVHLTGEAARFELAGKEHHHHFRCNQCERVFELAGCESDFRRLAPKGFQVTQHDLTLFGLCAECGTPARAVVSRMRQRPAQ
ncbi:MAG: transcriptional repressor [Bryobacterales bacterium]|nr:transcriptional repressor [Bryobacterales bacterium]